MEIKSLCISPRHISNKLTVGFKKTKEKLKDKTFWKPDKKKMMIASAVLLIGAAVYLNYIFFLEDSAIANGQNPTNESEIVNSSNASEENVSTYFAQAVLERQKARDEALEVLQIVVDNEDALAESKDNAMQQMAQIADDIQRESNIESLIVSKGFEECVAVISDGKCNIVVKSDGLMANQISQIKEIVYEQASINPVDVKIIEKN